MKTDLYPKCGICKKPESGMLIIGGVYRCPDCIVAALEQACDIIEQYPRMVRNILASKPVTNVPHLEAAAESWLKRNAVNAQEKTDAQ